MCSSSSRSRVLKKKIRSKKNHRGHPHGGTGEDLDILRLFLIDRPSQKAVGRIAMSSEGMSKMSMEDDGDEKPTSEKNSIAQRRKLFKRNRLCR